MQQSGHQFDELGVVRAVKAFFPKVIPGYFLHFENNVVCC